MLKRHDEVTSGPAKRDRAKLSLILLEAERRQLDFLHYFME